MSAAHRLALFTHIPKASGTTLARVIGQTFRPEQIFRIYEVAGRTLEQQREELIQRTRQADCPIRIVVGHEPCGLHAKLAAEVRYFTVLRDPVERVISDYYYVLRTPHHRLYAVVKCGELSLSSFAQKLPNRQTRFLAGMHEGNPVDADLERAVKNVTDHYEVAGVVERFDDSLAMIQMRFEWPIVGYTRENVGARRPKAETLSEEELAIVRQTNELDTALYEFALKRFAKQAEETGPRLAEHVQQLQEADPGQDPQSGLWQKVSTAVGRLLRSSR